MPVAPAPGGTSADGQRRGGTGSRQGACRPCGLCHHRCHRRLSATSQPVVTRRRCLSQLAGRLSDDAQNPIEPTFGFVIKGPSDIGKRLINRFRFLAHTCLLALQRRRRSCERTGRTEVPMVAWQSFTLRRAWKEKQKKTTSRLQRSEKTRRPFSKK